MLSRVADHLYWMSRYLERAEHTSRVMAVMLESMVEQTSEDAEAAWRRAIAALSGAKFASQATDAFGIAHALAFENLNPSSLLTSLQLARDNARQVREQISTEMWSHLNQLYLRLSPTDLRGDFGDNPALIFRDTLGALHTFEGIAYSTMRHGEGWYFIQLGRYIERAQLISRLVDLHVGSGSRAFPSARYTDWVGLLKSCTAFEAYCKVYTADIRPEQIAEFLLLDPEFPHSVRFAVESMREALARVAVGAPPARRAACDRLAGRLKANVDYGRIDELMGGDIAVFLAAITMQCEQIHDAVYESYIAYGAETVL